MPDTSLANMPYTEPPDAVLYARAARTLARMAEGDVEGLRRALEAIGHPNVQPAPPPPPPPKPPKRLGWQSKPYERCKKNLHDMSGSNLVVESSGNRRCRACRLVTNRRRKRGENRG